MPFVEASGTPPGEGVAMPAKALRLAAHLELLAGLDRTEAALRHLCGELLPKRRGQPETPDAIRFGIGALAGLWQQSRGIPPTSSTKTGQFGAMVRDGFRQLGGKVPEPAVKTALRTFIAGLRKAERSASPERVQGQTPDAEPSRAGRRDPDRRRVATADTTDESPSARPQRTASVVSRVSTLRRYRGRQCTG